jgi:REP element-mobilizing transposase RayT
LAILKGGLEWEIVFDTIGTDGDHLHVFVGGPLRYSPSKIMQIIKSILAREILNDILKSRSSFGVYIFGAKVGMLAREVMM